MSDRGEGNVTTVTDEELLARQFEAHRPRLRAVAYRMLGSLAEADDAVQEAWLRLTRSGAAVENLGGWLTTVIARVSVDMLRSRNARREEPLDEVVPEMTVTLQEADGPEADALHADAVSLALLVVLESLTPAERLAFVVHDMFDLPFDEIASIAGRSAAAVRQQASRALRRVRQAPVLNPDLNRQRQVVEAFFAAAREGDFDALISLLDPRAVARSDEAAGHRLMHGPAAIARQALRFANPAAQVRPALVNGAAGVIVTIGQRPVSVMGFTITHGKIAEINSVSDPAWLQHLNLDIPQT
jgi:RNA polymerase sigma-70 factor (ECF subfamily)